MNRDGHFKIKEKDNLKYLVFEKWEADTELIHCFTTRHGGVSTGCLESLNLGFNRGDIHENVMQNYQSVCDVLKVDLKSVVLSKQVHDTNIIKVELEDAGNGIFYNSKWESADGMYTSQPNITLVTHYADCVPLLFYAPGYSIIGMTHAGWRGTVKGIAGSLVDRWVRKERIPLDAIQVVIGPSIGECCFEVGKEVADAFVTAFSEQSFIKCNSLADKYSIDLWQCNKHILIKSGIKEENIFITSLCTSCNEDLFFSHRKSNGARGTLGAFMALRSVGDE
ncbi:peptidoglycan editing factor PgeF [Cellulosilyticum sp. I15G10I2]|uniref:peptidoglycan editing factor PgeF n=1 Tax=Cellulosilyticum sp. I15G10I2 TaxID=1892843 RepID=UPI00085C8944|nr:peptidoglycan editing factor PgeF [Cellulosilyticum sp. I15G10I2]